MKVRVDELRKIVEQLFTHLEETGREEFDLDKDYYWSIPKKTLYDPTKDVHEKLDMGQLSEDWSRIEETLSGESPPIAHALVWVASILRCLGEDAVY